MADYPKGEYTDEQFDIDKAFIAGSHLERDIEVMLEAVDDPEMRVEVGRRATKLAAYDLRNMAEAIRGPLPQ